MGVLIQIVLWFALYYTTTPALFLRLWTSFIAIRSACTRQTPDLDILIHVGNPESANAHLPPSSIQI